MSYSVVLTANAQRNVRGILRRLTTESSLGATAWFRRWSEVLSLLEATAGGCGKAPESNDHPVTIRQIIFKTRHGLRYRAVFTTHENHCVILHVRGPGQDLIPPNEMGIPN